MPYYSIKKKNLKKKDKYGKKGLVSKITIQLKSGLVAKIITGKRKYLDIIANCLIEYETLTGDEINNLLEGVKFSLDHLLELGVVGVLGDVPGDFT